MGLMMNDLLNKITRELREQFSNRVRLEIKRPGVYQIFLPMYHEDGDMVELYIDLRDENLNKSSLIRLSDFGMTVMRLSYSYDLDTPNKERIFRKIVLENGVEENQGELSLNVPMDMLFQGIMQICQAIAKVGSMGFFKREVIANLFYEELGDFIEERLGRFRPQKDVLPIPGHSEWEVDYQFTPNGHPVYLFGVKDTSKARLVALTCLELMRRNLDFKSFVVHQDMNSLPKKDRDRLTSASYKQFTTLDDFVEHGEQFLVREAKS